MKYYVKHEDGDIWGPMDKDQAEGMRDQLDDACIFDETIFDQKVVTGSVEGGVVDFDSVPAGVEVHINDYDTDGIDEDRLTEDEEGRLCVQSVYGRE
jgi:hypothetical protein